MLQISEDSLGHDASAGVIEVEMNGLNRVSEGVGVRDLTSGAELDGVSVQPLVVNRNQSDPGPFEAVPDPDPFSQVSFPP